jgi:hypothetical protein
MALQSITGLKYHENHFVRLSDESAADTVTGAVNASCKFEIPYNFNVSDTYVLCVIQVNCTTHSVERRC